MRVNSRSIVLIVVTAGNREVTAVVDELFQLFSNLEEGQPLGRNRNRFTRARVSTVVGFVRPNREAPNTSNLDTITLLQGDGPRIELLRL